MMKPNIAPPSPAASASKSGAERRRDKRYEIDLPGTVHFADEVHAVMISDLSAGGALIVSNPPFPSGTMLSLVVQDFGALDAKVVHAGRDFCGLQFQNAHLHRDRLTAWLHMEAKPS